MYWTAPPRSKLKTLGLGPWAPGPRVLEAQGPRARVLEAQGPWRVLEAHRPRGPPNGPPHGTSPGIPGETPLGSQGPSLGPQG